MLLCNTCMSLGNLRGEGLGQSGAIGGVDEYLAYIGLGGVLELDLMYDFTLHWIRGCSA